MDKNTKHMITPYFQDSHVTIYNKSCFDMSELPDNSIQCIVTSPPYWGLRKYKAPDLIFGGNNHHEHDFKSEGFKVNRWGKDKNVTQKQSTNAGAECADTPLGNTCSICGAWKGQYGLEPDVSLYVEHTIEWLREVRRVLRPDGVAFVNLGDSYAGSGGGHKPEHANPGLSKSAERDGVPHENCESEELDAAVNCDPADAWASGFFDGEGNIAITKNAGRSAGKLRIMAAQVDRSPIDRMQRLFGGAVRQASSKKQGWRSYWVWECSSQKAVDALKRMEPFLLVKKRQAELAYEFQKTVGTLDSKPRLTPEIIAERERIKQAISDCNHTTLDDAAEPLESKQLCLIPFRVALAAQSNGWWVRSAIIWNKPNPMPESVTDRPTDAYEFIFLFTKSARYYWDAQAVQEAIAYPDRAFSINHLDERKDKDNQGEYCIGSQSQDAYYAKLREKINNGETIGRNMRNVWTFPTQPYPEAHFATFPEELPERCIKAATPEYGCCDKCGKPYERIVEVHFVQEGVTRNRGRDKGAFGEQDSKSMTMGDGGKVGHNENKTLGWRQACKCDNSKPVPSTCLDPFGGSGTTAWVSKKLNRKAVLYEISEGYCKLALNRNRQSVML